MTKVLKMLELVDQNRMPKMQIWCGRIKTSFDSQRAFFLDRLRQPRLHFTLLNDFNCAA